jgi:hypothetical protein
MFLVMKSTIIVVFNFSTELEIGLISKCGYDCFSGRLGLKVLDEISTQKNLALMEHTKFGLNTIISYSVSSSNF